MATHHVRSDGFPSSLDSNEEKANRRYKPVLVVSCLLDTNSDHAYMPIRASCPEA